MSTGSPVRARTVFWALVAVAGGVRLLVALADYRSLVGNDVYPDDAFYYLRIAQNLVGGRGMTFDGAAPTNGFQPLYLLMIVPVVALARGSVALPIHLSGVLLTGWAVGTAFVLRALLARLAGRGAALFGVLLWAVSPYFILMSVNGLETGVALFFTLALPLAYCAWIHCERAPDAKRALAFGGLAGLAILARLDLALLLAAIAIDWLIRERARGWRAGSGVALTCAGALAVWLPWGIASHAATGHWLPASGAASREIALEWGWSNLQPIWTLVTPDRALFDPRHVPAAYHLDIATKLGVVFLFENPLLAPLRANVTVGPWADIDGFFPYRLLVANPFLATVLALVAAVGLAVAWRQTRPARPSAACAAIAPRAITRRVLAIYLVLFAIGYTWYAPTHWYFNRYLTAPILLTTVVLLAEATRWIAGGNGRRRMATAAIAVAIVACQLAQWRFFARLRWSDAPPGGFLAAWEALAPHIGPDQRVGAFQAGIYGYFSGRDIVNLDGKVNQDAAAALRDGRLDAYIRALNLRYVIEAESVFRVLHHHQDPASGLSFRPVAAIGGTRLYEVVDTTGRVHQ
jgi:hypothetical protein